MTKRSLLRKGLAWTLAFVLGMGALTACSKESGSSENETNAPTNTISEDGDSEGPTSEGDDTGSGESIQFPLTETKTYSVFAVMTQDYDLKDNVTMKKFLEDHNVTFEYSSVMAADLIDRRNLLLQTGDYPDIFMKSALGIGDQDRYVKQELFVALDDYIHQYAPNLVEHLDDRNGWEYMRAGDGHIYSLPEIVRPEPALTPYWINKRWMDNLGLEEPTSIDELYTVLKAFKDEDANGNGDPNDEIPWTANTGVKPDLIMPYFGVNYDYGTRLAVVDGELQFIPTTDVFKQYIEFVTKVYAEGILDQNVFTQLHEQQAAVGQSADVLGSFFDAGAFLTVGRDNDEDYIGLTAFEDGTYPKSTGVVPGTLVVTDKAENPEIVVAMFDYFYSEEGAKMALLGIEGETWEMKEDGTWSWIIGSDIGVDIPAVRANGTIQGVANHPSIWPEFWYENMSEDVDPDEVYLNGQRAKLVAKGDVSLPSMRYSEEDSLTIATLQTDIYPFIDLYVAEVATGEKSLDDSWDDFQNQLKDMGIDQLIEIFNKAYTEATAQ